MKISSTNYGLVDGLKYNFFWVKNYSTKLTWLRLINIVGTNYIINGS